MKSLHSYRARATKLRMSGLSYNEIRKSVPVAKSTLSTWLKNVNLKPEHRKRLYSKQIEILSLGSQSQKERRIREVNEIIEKARKEITLPLSKNTHRLFGAALYWAEGSKGSRFEITNSDPFLILFMVNWLKKEFDISPTKLKVNLNIYKQQNEIDTKKFWSKLCGIPLSNFGKSFVKPLSSGYKSNNLYYGTIKVRVPQGTDLRHRVFGWIQAALDDISPSVKITQKRWQRLKNIARPVNLEHDLP